MLPVSWNAFLSLSLPERQYHIGLLTDRKIEHAHRFKFFTSLLAVAEKHVTDTQILQTLQSIKHLDEISLSQRIMLNKFVHVFPQHYHEDPVHMEITDTVTIEDKLCAVILAINIGQFRHYHELITQCNYHYTEDWSGGVTITKTFLSYALMRIQDPIAFITDFKQALGPQMFAYYLNVPNVVPNIGEVTVEQLFTKHYGVHNMQERNWLLSHQLFADYMQWKLETTAITDIDTHLKSVNQTSAHAHRMVFNKMMSNTGLSSRKKTNELNKKFWRTLLKMHSMTSEELFTNYYRYILADSSVPYSELSHRDDIDRFRKTLAAVTYFVKQMRQGYVEGSNGYGYFTNIPVVCKLSIQNIVATRYWSISDYEEFLVSHLHKHEKRIIGLLGLIQAVDDAMRGYDFDNSNISANQDLTKPRRYNNRCLYGTVNALAYVATLHKGYDIAVVSTKLATAKLQRIINRFTFSYLQLSVLPTLSLLRWSFGVIDEVVQKYLFDYFTNSAIGREFLEEYAVLTNINDLILEALLRIPCPSVIKNQARNFVGIVTAVEQDAVPLLIVTSRGYIPFVDCYIRKHATAYTVNRVMKYIFEDPFADKQSMMWRLLLMSQRDDIKESICENINYLQQQLQNNTQLMTKYLLNAIEQGDIFKLLWRKLTEDVNDSIVLCLLHNKALICQPPLWEMLSRERIANLSLEEIEGLSNNACVMQYPLYRQIIIEQKQIRSTFLESLGIYPAEDQPDNNSTSWYNKASSCLKNMHDTCDYGIRLAFASVIITGVLCLYQIYNINTAR